MSEGLLYEPRSLWSIGYVTRTGNNPGVVLRLNRQHFMNGTRHPMTLERVAIAPINYIVRRAAAGNLPAALPFYVSSVINRISVSISAPFRQHYSGSQRFTLAPTTAPLPTYTPPVRSASGVEPQESNLWGLSALNFDRPMYVPRDGACEWDLAALPPSGRLPAVPLGGQYTLAYILFQEEGGLFAGNTRGRGWRQLSTLVTVAQPLQQTDEGFPYMLDPVAASVGAPAIAVGAEGGTAFSDPWRGLHIGAREYKAQANNRSGSSKVIGMRAMLNQISYDDIVDGGGMYPNDPVEPLANRVGTRVRNNAGTNEWWWRPGAPMSLVMDTITPAIVYKLPSAITLGPGDTLDIQLQFPGIISEQIEADIPFQIGVALNGWAAIEG